MLTTGGEDDSGGREPQVVSVEGTRETITLLHNNVIVVLLPIKTLIMKYD